MNRSRKSLLKSSGLVRAAGSFGALIKTSAVTVIHSQQVLVRPWLVTRREVSEVETAGKLDGQGVLGTGAHELLPVCCQRRPQGAEESAVPFRCPVNLEVQGTAQCLAKQTFHLGSWDTKSMGNLQRLLAKVPTEQVLFHSCLSGDMGLTPLGSRQ